MSVQKVVVITGAGRGLGKELAKAFSDKGYTVAALGRNADALHETKDYAASSAPFSMHTADVAIVEQVVSAFKEIVELHGRIDVLFNNAAVYPRINFLDESAEQWSAAMATNVNGVAHCCKVVLPTMIEQDYGRIFNVGSWAHLGPIEKSAAYSASKGCVRSLTKAIAADIAALGKNVQVNEWIPGHLNTRMSDFTGIDPALAANWGVEIAQIEDVTTESRTYENNWQWQPPKSLKQRILGKLLFWR